VNNDEIRVTGFGVHGKNITDAPISDFHGYLRSDVTSLIPARLLRQQRSTEQEDDAVMLRQHGARPQPK
jgi:hypothetical protein